MKGTLFGVGVGPGDPELLTLKALRLIKEAERIAVPGKRPEDSVAYKIVKEIYPELSRKKLLAVPMPMTKDPEKLETVHEEGAKMIREELEQGNNVVFLTLGDPTVYSTYLYIHKRIMAWDYPVEIVSGVTSFCAAAAKSNISLVEKAEELHVIPASYQIEEALKLPGTKVLMKAGKKMCQVKDSIRAQGAEAVMVENCGMESEKIYGSVDEIPDDAGYYSLIIVKDQQY